MRIDAINLIVSRGITASTNAVNMKTLLKRFLPNLYLAYANWKLGGAAPAYRAVSIATSFWFSGIWSAITGSVRKFVSLFRSKQIAILALITTALVLFGLSTPEVTATSGIAASRLFEMLMKWNFVLVPSFAGYAIYYAFSGHEVRGVPIAPLSAEWERKNNIMSRYVIGTMIAWALQLRL